MGNCNQGFDCFLAKTQLIDYSLAECKRGFSKINAFASKERAMLKVENIASPMFISIAGPPCHEFMPSKYGALQYGAVM